MPFISKEHIKLLTSKIDYFEMSTLGCPFIDKKEFQDLNKVKLLIKEDNKNVVAENFFREPMHASEMNVNTFHHIGLYGYQISFLKKFLQMPISEREKTEKLEQLRIQDLNKIGVSIIKENILGVDTKEDLIKVNNILKK
jgi:3-deoxy-manno-octulosonate cytidylyltransferase (CMP-KDO synthetase)